MGKPSRVLTSAAGIEVKQTLQLPSRPEVFAIGDIAVFTDESGRRLPMLAPVAIQGGKRAAENIRRMLARKEPLTFAYRDKGIMATIGRHAAVVEVGRFRLRGFPAWLTWLFLHLMFLVSFRSRLLVLINWSWNYLFHERPARLILNSTSKQVHDETARDQVHLA